jgi:hypothetical protein
MLGIFCGRLNPGSSQQIRAVVLPQDLARSLEIRFVDSDLDSADGMRVEPLDCNQMLIGDHRWNIGAFELDLGKLGVDRVPIRGERDKGHEG